MWAAFGLAVVTTPIALQQYRQPYAFHPPRTGVDWLAHPLEWNLASALAEIDGDLNTVAVDRRGVVWIAGNNGLLAFSSNGGRRWVRVPFDPASGGFRNSPTAVPPNPPRIPASASAEGPLSWLVPPVNAAGQAQSPIQPANQSPMQQRGVPNTQNQGKPEAPDRLLYPLALPFLPTEVGKASSAKATLKNAGGQSIVLKNVSITPEKAGFFMSGMLCRNTLEPGAECIVEVMFRPVAPGYATAQLLVDTGGSTGPYKIALTGTGEAVPSAGKATPPDLSKGQQKQPPVPATPVESHAVPDLKFLRFTESQEGMLLAVVPDDKRGTESVLVTNDGGVTWRPGTASQRALIRSDFDRFQQAKPDLIGRFHLGEYGAPSDVILVPPSGEAWAVGPNGVVLHSTDQGSLWLPVTRGAVPAVMRGDGPYWRLPPPWYLLTLLLCVAMAALYRPAEVAGPGEPEVQEDEPGIADKAVSDKPLEPGQPDALELRKLAAGLSYFLRNPNTVPPLVIGINGKWGSGKSSLMNLLKEDLRRAGTQPVWFNAWHHQSEEQLLAALLQTVRQEAVPPLFSAGMLPFRWRLLRRRLGNHSGPVIAAVLILAVLVGAETGARSRHNDYLWKAYRLAASQVTTPPPDKQEVALKLKQSAESAAQLVRRRGMPQAKEQASDLSSQVKGEKEELQALAKSSPEEAQPLSVPANQLAEGVKQLAESWSNAPESSAGSFTALAEQFQSLSQVREEHSHVPFLSMIIGVITVLTYTGKVLKAFGANPAALLATVSPGKSEKEVEAQTSFRQRFAQEFREVTDALGERRMLILIDDLDRCRPEKVREVLEAVNFLSSSGDCFLVLGMDRQIIKHCVGLSFRRMVDSMPAKELGLKLEPESGTTPTSDSNEVEIQEAYAKRVFFASAYLEKLVQIEVDIPVPDTAQRQKLFTEEERQPKPDENEARAQLVVGWVRQAAAAVPAILLLALLGAGGWLGYAKTPEVVTVVKEIVIAQDSPPAVPAVPVAGTIAAASSAGTAPVPSSGTSGPSMAPRVEPQIVDASVAHVAAWLFYALLAVFAAGMTVAVFVAITRRDTVHPHDSPRFLQALGIWHPLVMERQNTPRAAKRFVNRVRYLAMRQHAQHSPEYPLWERWLRRRLGQNVSAATPVETGEQIPDTLLVALAAIHEYKSDLVTNTTDFQAKVVNAAESAAVPEIHLAAKAHQDRLKDYAKIAEFREGYLALCSELGRR